MEKQKVIMVMLDTLMDKALQLALKEETLPALEYFMDHADYYPDVVTPFPAMSVNVEATLLTGEYCDKHHLPALSWYSKQDNRIINYGTHIMELLKMGLSRSVYDVIYRLNNEHLNSDVKTIHEEIHERGKESASINPLVHRGASLNTLTMPPLMRFFLSVDKTVEVRSPSKFVYGSLNKLSPLKKYSHLWNKCGFNNDFSVQEFSHLVKNNEIPAFSFVYLPDHDKNVHKHGPMEIKGIKKMDQQIQTILDSFPTWGDALENNIWILIGDNGQSRITSDRQHASVDLRKVLNPLKITKLRKGVQKDDQIVLGINLRSCYIYSLNIDEVPLTDIVEKLKVDSRIEMIAWKKADWIHVTSGGNEGSLQFKENGNMKDVYNQTWDLAGDYSILDLKVDGNNIEFGEFPDALKRIHSSLYSHKGDFVVTTVKPEHEFIGESTPTHVGGASHGGLHKNDTLIPMIVTGTSTSPDYLRVVDLKDWILSLTNFKV
ncbi:alkaline phosphatase family protein [Alteribacter populi]|uniref:alkaline phosphatase family protein n=1 Tax=Alteribacter populi TaxID=2011011 RepID=UPI000BBAE9B2|nr:alkaline phosphatase family protein [Alteribacter populi]